MAVLKDCAQFLSALPGIDWGDLYFQRSASRSLSYSDGKVEEVSSSSSAGCSARLLKGKSSAFAVVSGIERGGAARALGEASRIAAVRCGSVPDVSFPLERVQAFFPENVDFFGETCGQSAVGSGRSRCPAPQTRAGTSSFRRKKAMPGKRSIVLLPPR